MAHKLVIHGNVYRNGGFSEAFIGIDNGKITAIGKDLDCDRQIDFGEKLILPGAIDAHVHLRDPGFPEKEDFHSGTLAAAFGGVTCVFDMPNTKPPTTTVEALADKIAIAEKKACVDFGIYSALLDKEAVPGLAADSIGFKLYMGETTGGLVSDRDGFEGLVQSAIDAGRITFIHAENGRMFKTERAYDRAGHLLNRPAEAEASAIEEVVEHFGQNSEKLHVTHVSTVEGAKMLNSAGISADSCSHYLLLNTDSPLEKDTFGRVNPPLRGPDEQKELLQMFVNGDIGMLTSDHAPHTIDEKSRDFNDAPSGMPGVETMVPLFLALWKKGVIPIERLINAVCERPADLFGLPKGRISVGNDADFMVIDKDNVTTIKGERLHSKCGWSAFKGHEAIFPVMTMVRGKMVIAGEDVVEEGVGKRVVL